MENPEKSIVKVMISEPTNGYIYFTAHDNRLDFVMELARLEQRSRFKFYTGNIGRLMVQYAREIICDEALKAGMDYILFIDDDMIVPKDLFEQLIKTDADIVAPVACCRSYPYSPVIYRIKKTMAANGLDYQVSSVSMTDYEPNSIVIPDAVGFGVVLLKTEILKTLPKPWFFVNQPVGEDILFCMRAREHDPNFSIKVDTSIKVGHLGDVPVITEDTFQSVKGTPGYAQFLETRYGK